MLRIAGRTLHGVRDTEHIASHATGMTDLHSNKDEECVPRMLRSAISAFTRVFDALWSSRRGALLIRGPLCTPHRSSVTGRSGASSGAHSRDPLASPGELHRVRDTRQELSAALIKQARHRLF